MNNKLLVSVIIVTKNRPHKLANCLAALKKNTEKSFELIVVDQSDQPINQQKLKKQLNKFSNHTYLPQEKTGKSKGLNLAIKNSNASILAFTDDDCLPQSDWIENIVKSFETKKNVVAVFGKTLPYQPSKHRGQTCPSIFDKSDSKVINKPCKHWEEIGFGNNMSWKKEFFTEFGLFKEWLGPGSIGSNAEDAEISLRALKNRQPIFYNPNVVVYHNKWLTKQELKRQYRSYKQGEVFCYGYLALSGEKIGRIVIKDNLNQYFSNFKIVNKLKIKRRFEERKSIDVILKLMTNEEFCPTIFHSRLNEEMILKLIKRNKVDFSLSHFITCSKCQAKRSSGFIEEIKILKQKKVFQTLLYKKELSIFKKIKKKLKKSAIIYKTYNPNYNSPSDIDILVAKVNLSDFIKEYRAKNYQVSKVISQKEIHLTNPANNFSVDLHFLLACPHFFTPTKSEMAKIKAIGQEMLSLQDPDQLESSLPKSIILSSLLIRYWHNELWCGLKNLHEITLLASSFNSKKEVDNLINTLEKYQMLNLGLLTFNLGSRIFGVSLSKKIADKTPFFINFMLFSISKYEISIFPHINSWHHPQNLSWSIKFNNKLNFIKLVISEENGWWRKLKPRIVLFIVFQILLTFGKNVFSWPLTKK